MERTLIRIGFLDAGPSERNHAGVEAAFWKKPNGREKGSDSTWHLEPNGTPFKKSGKTFKQGTEEMLEK